MAGEAATDRPGEAAGAVTGAVAVPHAASKAPEPARARTPELAMIRTRPHASHRPYPRAGAFHQNHPLINTLERTGTGLRDGAPALAWISAARLRVRPQVGDRQEPLDHGVHLAGDLQLDEV